MVSGDQIVEAARELVENDVAYTWWHPMDPIPMWSYDYPVTVPPIEYMIEHGTMCSDLVNYARMKCGLGAIGGTPAYYDWLLSYNTGSDFDASSPGIPGAICVNPGIWRGGSGQGHIAIYSDGHTLIQATDGSGEFAGCNEGEQDYDSHSWANYWLYGLMPDVDYSAHVEPNDDPGQVHVVKDPVVNWFAIGADGIVRLGGEDVDYSGGWIGQTSDRRLIRVK